MLWTGTLSQDFVLVEIVALDTISSGNFLSLQSMLHSPKEVNISTGGCFLSPVLYCKEVNNCIIKETWQFSPLF